MEILYPGDLSDNEYEIIESYIPKAKRGGRPRTVNVRSVMNGVFNLLKTGCQRLCEKVILLGVVAPSKRMIS